MIITTCAACAALLAHEAPRCVRCKTRYCNSTCQHDHWRRGHKQICKRIHRGGNAEQYNADNKYKEAVAAAVEACAEDTKGQTCYICTEAVHWKTKEGVVRGCACRGTAGVAHVSCLTEQAKILVAEAEENNSDDNQGHRWYLCGLCKQDYHGDVRCALGWAVWKTYVGLPEDNRYRCCALAQLGTGLGAMGRNEEELSILEACWDIEKRRARAGAQVDLLAIQGKIANCYGELGRHPDALRVRREILAMRRKIYAPEDLPVLHDVTNLGVSLNHLRMYTESQPLWRKYIPVARRVLGRDHNLTTTMIKGLAAAISQHGDAPRDGLLEAIKMLSENSQRLRQVLGDTHPETQQNECSLKFLRGRLACLETKDT